MPSMLRSILNHRGAVLFALLQAAPVDVQVRDNGRFALAFGIGGDAYEQARYSCDGSTLESRTVTSRTHSGTVNIPLRRGWSVEGIGGSTSTDSPVCADPTCSLPPAFKGGFGGLRFHVDGGDAALALGALSLPGVDIDYVNGTHEISREVTPSVMLRVGTLLPGRKHFRAEINGVPTPGSPPMNTFGFGVTAAEGNPTRVFIGLAIPSYSAAENGSLLLRGELMVPAGRRASLNFGAAGNTSIMSVHAGLRVHSPRPRAGADSVP